MFKLIPILIVAADLHFSPDLRAAESVTISGITEPFLDVTLGLADAGIIRQQFFKEGDAVNKGDAILELDKRLETYEVERRKAVMVQNKMVFDSTHTLLENTKSVSLQEMNKAEAEYNVAAADYNIAVQQLANRQLVAPFSGRITEILLKPGAAIAPYQPLVRLVDTSRCYFVGHIESKAAANLQLDESVQIHVDGGVTIPGKICFISPTVDAASGLAKVKAIFENADSRIRPGLAAQLTTE
jgi:membrane fusion protein (multidrug efflux system)